MSERELQENVAALPLVSIVIPAYNHGEYLRECIESVLTQSYPRVELIVLDDGSADNTIQVLNAYGNRFRWETQVNMGQSATLSKGWDMANGELLGYLSADDVIYPNAIAAAVSLLAHRPDVVMVYPDFDLISEKSKKLKTIKTPEYRQAELVLDLVCQAGPGALFRRDAYAKAGPWNAELRQNPDLDFWLRLSLQGQFCRIPEILAGFRVHVGSTTYQAAAMDRAEEPFQISKNFAARVALPVWMSNRRHCIVGTGHVASAQLHIRAGRFAHALGHLWVALRTSPGTFFSRRSVHMTASALKSYCMHRLKISR